MHLVDLPDVAAEVVQRVVTVASGPSGLAQASYDGRIGHPVLLGPDHWETLLSVASGDRGASALLASRPHMEVECGDLAGGHDVDGPDLRR